MWRRLGDKTGCSPPIRHKISTGIPVSEQKLRPNVHLQTLPLCSKQTIERSSPTSFAFRPPPSAPWSGLFDWIRSDLVRLTLTPSKRLNVSSSRAELPDPSVFPVKASFRPHLRKTRLGLLRYTPIGSDFPGDRTESVRASLPTQLSVRRVPSRPPSNRIKSAGFTPMDSDPLRFARRNTATCRRRASQITDTQRTYDLLWFGVIRFHEAASQQRQTPGRFFDIQK